MKDIKENFCPACLAIPLVFAGVGGAGAAKSSEENPEETIKRKKMNKFIYYTSIATVILSIAVFIYYMFIKKCEDCTKKLNF